VIFAQKQVWRGNLTFFKAIPPVQVSPILTMPKMRRISDWKKGESDV
jgi:hypothetical protein